MTVMAAVMLASPPIKARKSGIQTVARGVNRHTKVNPKGIMIPATVESLPIKARKNGTMTSVTRANQPTKVNPNGIATNANLRPKASPKRRPNTIASRAIKRHQSRISPRNLAARRMRCLNEKVESQDQQTWEKMIAARANRGTRRRARASLLNHQARKRHLNRWARSETRRRSICSVKQARPIGRAFVFTCNNP